VRVTSDSSTFSRWRITVEKPANDNNALSKRAERFGYRDAKFCSKTVFYVEGQVSRNDVELIAEKLIDEAVGPVSFITQETELSDKFVIEVALRAGVTDRVAAQLRESAQRMGFDVRIATGVSHAVEGIRELSEHELTKFVNEMLCNPVIETWGIGHVEPGFVSEAPDESALPIEIIPIRQLDENGLRAVNLARSLVLDDQEMLAIQTWCRSIERDPTDAELETIAQTWSEHCSHKTFRAEISDTNGNRIVPLMEQLRESTIYIAAPFVVSAFVGNAGIVQFGDSPALAVKVETHNHPSAIEPFGGANTGVGGVVRDVLAAPARPVALLDVLCFGMRDTDVADLPTGVLHPSIVEEGVVAGIADYGNKIGVPTVAGAVLYDAGYVGNPLVFCGCVGQVLQGYPSVGEPGVGDRIVVIGGATGRDGLKGATFSSATMDATTGEVAGASVQIGDPIVERLVGEVLVELFDQVDPLCTAITDCGAGGLSSAIGEMAERLGARVQLRQVLRKYPGLAPWEVWLSEAQERMVVAVDPAHVTEVLALCARLGVQATDVGVFSGTGQLEVFDGERSVVDMSCSFLHDGRPPRKMIALIEKKIVSSNDRVAEVSHSDVLVALLSHPTIASKEAIIRRYDHEILGSTVIGPMSAPYQTGPSDGVVIVEPMRQSGFALGIGVNPQYGVFDCEAMAWSAVDEAIRNVVVAGANPARVALLDNFSWGDPRREKTLGDLVLAVRGCCNAARAFSSPFVSGKDSLNNEYEGTDGIRRSIPPTLVITALAEVPDVDCTLSTTLSSAGNVLILAGATRNEMRGSHFDLVQGTDGGGEVPGQDVSAPKRYQLIHELIISGCIQSAHDCSEGGLGVALAEMCLSSTFGISADLRLIHANDVVAMYSESNGRIILEVCPNDVERVVSTLGSEVVVLGEITTEQGLRISLQTEIVEISHLRLQDAWMSHV